MQLKEDFIFIYVFFILIIFVWLYHQYQRRELVMQLSKVNNLSFLVRKQEDESEQIKAADTLARLSEVANTLIDKMVAKYKNKDPRVTRLKKRFKKDSLSESLSSSNQTSYSVNKGESIVMCIRSKKDHSLIDDNTLTFVLLHELGHLMSVTIGHNDEFWNNFRFILAHALHWKIYRYQHFSKKPMPYCGISITDTPLTWDGYNKFVKTKEFALND